MRESSFASTLNDNYSLSAIRIYSGHIDFYVIIDLEDIMGTVVESVLHGKSRLSENGRIVIPSQIREAMGISAGDPVLMELEDGVLRIESHRSRIRRIQEEFRKHVPIRPGEMLMSDQLIAERREEARREMEETDRQIEEYRLRNERQLG
ncbi:MAG: AbrB/MazE/SpoVT family DNA-binding domain-containing protein [Terracidiphilus sp.]|jgi:AbrB family looped-hinge helix DNA binding protein